MSEKTMTVEGFLRKYKSLAHGASWWDSQRKDLSAMLRHARANGFSEGLKRAEEAINLGRELGRP